MDRMELICRYWSDLIFGNIDHDKCKNKGQIQIQTPKAMHCIETLQPVPQGIYSKPLSPLRKRPRIDRPLEDMTVFLTCAFRF
jgi:hypothetical protein